MIPAIKSFAIYFLHKGEAKQTQKLRKGANIMKKKIALMVTSLVLVVALSIGGTLAYLTSQTGAVTNTFTVGNVKITLDESELKDDGTLVASNKVYANKYKLYPGATYLKDPTVHVDDGSDDCWLFVKVENGIEPIEAGKEIADQMTDNGWALVSGETNVFAYKEIAKAGIDYPVFGQFTISGELDNDGLAQYKEAKIVITAYAVQTDGFDTAAAAWTKAPTTWTTP